MSNLLDKASIILTPTAYNNGEALCVKPSDGSGDFDFSRNSAATRVNAQGLVENVQILSSNLVQNGDFSEEGSEEVSNGSFSQEGSEEITNGDFSVSGTPNTSSWALGWYSNTNNVEIANGKLTLSNSAIESASRAYATNGVNSNNILTTNKFYKLQYDIVENNGATDLKYYSANGSFISVPSVDVGSYTLYIQNTSNSLFLFQLVTSNSSISIDNVSVREVGQDWSLGTGWSIGEDKAICDGNAGHTTLTQINSFLLGKTYKVTFDIVVDSGNFKIQLLGGGADSGNIISSTQVGYTEYISPTANRSSFGIRSNDGNGIGSITNISVKEVGQNWTLIGTATITENQANIVTASAVTGISQSNVLTIGESYKLTYNIVSNNNGGLKISGNEIPSVVGNNTYYFEATATALEILRNSGATDVTITNISVIEITDDTNLPRINYEGFSYQDALGSELNPNTYIADKSANLTLNGTQLQIDNGGENYARARANVVLVSGKTYRAKVTCINQGTNGASFYVLAARPFGTINMISGETYEVTFVADSFYTPFYENKVGGSGLIVDNISIKEYLGQEVVPDSGCGSWLWEPQSSNLLTYSSDYNNSIWSKTGSASVTSNTTISPDGTQNADTLNIFSGNFFFQPVVGVGTFTLSCYVKVPNGTLDFKMQSFNGTDGANSSGIFVATTEWQRFEHTVTVTVNSSFYPIQVSGLVGGDFEIWGAQVEALSYATSYIPTSGSIVTRNQDLCTNGGSLASINSTEGTLYFEGAALADDGTTRIISLSDGTTANRVNLFFDTTNTLRAFITGVPSIATAAVITDNNKVALKFKSGDISVWLNGTEVATSTSTISLSGLSNLSFNQVGSSPFFGKTKALAVFPYLSDSELQSLTTI